MNLLKKAHQILDSNPKIYNSITKLLSFGGVIAISVSSGVFANWAFHKASEKSGHHVPEILLDIVLMIVTYTTGKETFKTINYLSDHLKKDQKEPIDHKLKI